MIDQDMSADYTSDPIESLYNDTGSYQVVWSGADDVDGEMKLESSHDKVNWDEIPNTLNTLDSAAGSKSVNLTNVGYPWVRAVFTSNSNTTGTVTMYLALKSTRG
jgi:hypothetical protein